MHKNLFMKQAHTSKLASKLKRYKEGHVTLFIEAGAHSTDGF